MRYYFIRRLLLAIPGLMALALFSFWLTLNMPGDPVLTALNQEGTRLGEDPFNGPVHYTAKWKELHLNHPVFYFSLLRGDEVDSLFDVPFASDKAWVSNLSSKSGLPEKVMQFYRNLSALEYELFQQESDSTRNALLTGLRNLRDEPISQLNPQLIFLQNTFNYPALGALRFPGEDSWDKTRVYVPQLVWYGSDNLFHHWLVGIILGNWGNSYRDGRPVLDKLPEAMKWTVLVNGLSLILAFGVSIPAGVYAARRYGSLGERSLNAIWFVLYSLPSFWVATLLILFFSSGLVLDILPAGGISDIRSSEAWPWYRRLLDISRHLILPTFAYAYGSFAYLSGQIRNSMIENLQSDFVRTGRAKGLSESFLAWKHAFRNSLLPLITISGQILPGLIGGSVILETIFSIPGMGLLAWQALNYRDYPLMIALFMLSGLLTLVGLLLSDMLYPLADPRIRFDTNESGR